jgi:hypothetical protein
VETKVADAKLTFATLDGAYLGSTYLHGVDMTGATVKGTYFIGLCVRRSTPPDIKAGPALAMDTYPCDLDPTVTLPPDSASTHEWNDSRPVDEEAFFSARAAAWIAAGCEGGRRHM